MNVEQVSEKEGFEKAHVPFGGVGPGKSGPPYIPK